MKDIKISIQPYSEKYLPDMVKLFTYQYKNLLHNSHGMPHKYLDLKINHQMIEWLFENYEGVVTLRDDQLIGYLGGMIVPHFKSSHTGIYTPEWGHALMDGEANHMYDQMLNELSKHWGEVHYAVHSIAFLKQQQATINQMFWNGYGMFLIDAVRPVFADEPSFSYQIREANVYDWDQLVDLIEANHHYLTNYPTYSLLDLNKCIEELEEDLQDPHVHLWVVEIRKELVGFIKTVEDSKESCNIVRDRKTLMIESVFVKEEHRKQGIGKAMLRHINDWAYEEKFERLSVNFESANKDARKFLLNYFEPICYTLIRYLDDRLLD
jgi:GNAT superfamily N-acetyltransferase